MLIYALKLSSGDNLNRHGSLWSHEVMTSKDRGAAAAMGEQAAYWNDWQL
jgi:hypothetical protein